MFGRKRTRSVIESLPDAAMAHEIEADIPAAGAAVDTNADAQSSGFYFPPDREMLIGEGVAMAGEIRNCARLVIAGSFSGTLFASEVIVLTKAALTAVVVADRIDIFGSVAGEIVAAGHVRFRDSAVFEGRLVYSRMLVDPGALLTGELSQVATEDEQRALDELASYGAGAAPRDPGGTDDGPRGPRRRSSQSLPALYG